MMVPMVVGFSPPENSKHQPQNIARRRCTQELRPHTWVGHMPKGSQTPKGQKNLSFWERSSDENPLLSQWACENHSFQERHAKPHSPLGSKKQARKEYPHKESNFPGKEPHKEIFLSDAGIFQDTFFMLCVFPPFWTCIDMPTRTCSANKGLPPPLGRGVCETKSKNGRSRPRKHFISRVFCAQRRIETMVHGLRPWSRKGPDHGVGVHPRLLSPAHCGSPDLHPLGEPCFYTGALRKYPRFHGARTRRWREQQRCRMQAGKGRSRSYSEIKLLLHARRWVVAKLHGDKFPSRSSWNFIGEQSDDHDHQDFQKILRYKWEAYCNTNRRRTAIQMGGVLTVFPAPQSVGAQKHCSTNWRRIAIQIGGALWEVVVVGVSDILLIYDPWISGPLRVSWSTLRDNPESWQLKRQPTSKQNKRGLW